VLITIFNILGERAEELVNERKENGFHKVQFSPHNLPSGVYYYRVTVEEKTTTKKLLLIK
jgi:hypothetical protein